MEPRVAVSLGNFQKPSPRVLLQVHVVFFVIFVHDLRLQLALPQIVGINLAKAAIELDKLGEVLMELTSSREGHQNLVLGPGQ